MARRLLHAKTGYVTAIVTAFLLTALHPHAGPRQPTAEPLISFAHKVPPALRDQVYALEHLGNYVEGLDVILSVDADFYRRSRELTSRGRAGADSNPNALDLVQAYTARLTTSQIRQLVQSEVVDYVTLDATVRPTISVDNLADRSTVGVWTLEAERFTFSVSPIVVAVFDSGIQSHPDSNGVDFAVDFTSGSPVQKPNVDPYGHGTHVAGIVGGNGNNSEGLITGVDPKVKFIDVRVIGDDGTGLTSNLIKAIDWVIANKSKYQIRIGNFSVGHPPLESYAKDPLCQAVERLVAAGIVAVVSAGNLGKSAVYPQIWGGINSPGNDPTVITVAPINTRGTHDHSDDAATTYGSRGPTFQDGLFKPDLCAPGNGIISWAAEGSYIDRIYAELAVDQYYTRLSGASMATPFVAGTVARMLEANSSLTPNLVKLILLLTAVKLRQPHMLEQGNGLVNSYTAVKLAKAIDVKNQRLLSSVSPSWSYKGTSVSAGGAFAYGDQLIFSPLIDPLKTKFWGNGIVWVDNLLASDAILWVDRIFQPKGVYWGSSLYWGKSNLAWTNGIFWADGILWVDGIKWADQTVPANGIFWADKVFGSARVFGVGNPQGGTLAGDRN